MIPDLGRALELSTSRLLKEDMVSTVNWKKSSFLQSGLGLVELMVAMVIGIIGVLVMMQMFAVSEEQKRTTVSGSDSLTSGAIALATLQRDIQQSGWGISDSATIGCKITGLINGGGSLLLAPVSINPPGITADDHTDVIQVVSGGGNGTVEGALINAQPSANQYDVLGSESFGIGEMVFAAPAIRASPCDDFPVTTVTGVARPNVNVGAGVAGMAKGRLFSLGAAPTVRLYAVRGKNLTVCDHMVADCAADTSHMTSAQVNSLWVPIAENIVSMRAVYLPAGNQTSPTCGWGQIPAIKLVLVARSSQPEKTLDWPNIGPAAQHVTGATPTWTSSVEAAISLPSPKTDWPTWQDFRYKVFESVIPLRNVIAAGGAAEC